jgi:hypothetical protein
VLRLAKALVIALLPAAFLAAQEGAPAPAPGEVIPPLPREKITVVYKNGDIDSVIYYLKAGRNKPVFMDRMDSALAFKYLGVIYSADDAMREKGRYYYNQLLRLDPSASVTDLLPGEKARVVFREVRDEYFELNPHLEPKSAASAATQAQPAPNPPAQDGSPAPAAAVAPKKSNPRIWWWVAGGVLAAGTAAAVATVVMLDPDPEVRKLHD